MNKAITVAVITFVGLTTLFFVDRYWHDEADTSAQGLDMTIFLDTDRNEKVVVDLGRPCFLLSITSNAELLANKDKIHDAKITTKQDHRTQRGCAIVDELDAQVFILWESGTADVFPLSDFTWIGDKSQATPAPKWPNVGV